MEIEKVNNGRRRLIKNLGTLGIASTLSGIPFAKAFASSSKVKMGFIFVGAKDDYGYNQSHFEGEKTVANLDWVKTVDEERVLETIEVVKVMESMINLDGTKVLFPTSFGYFDPYILKLAPKYPDVMFLHCGGLWTDKDPKNVGSYFGYIDEAVYLSGIVAGHMTKTNKLGFIAAIPIPQVLRNINSFTLGAQSVNPDITTSVVFTGGWSNPVKEAESANSLVDKGVDVLTCHVDSPKIIVQTAERRGIYSCGYHTNQSALAPKGFLTGAEWNWGKVYMDYAEMIEKGTKIPNLVRGGIKEGIVKTSPYGSVVTDKAKKDADIAHAKFMEGDMVVYKGPILNNKGETVIKDGEAFKQTDIRLESMDWLVKGVIGTTKG